MARILAVVAATLLLPISTLSAGTPDPMQTTVTFTYAANFIDMSIQVNNAQGMPVTTPLTITVAHAPGSGGLTIPGIALDLGGGSYTVALLPQGGVGIDIFAVDISDGATVTVVTPAPELCVGDIAGGLSDDCNGNFVPDDCEISAGLVPDANNNGIPDDCESFRRGDCNGDGIYDFIDFLHGLNFLFTDAGLTLECEDACDCDDNGRIDVHDMVVLIQAMFTAGPGIAQPFPNCGLDTTADNLPCTTYSICP